MVVVCVSLFMLCLCCLVFVSVNDVCILVADFLTLNVDTCVVLNGGRRGKCDDINDANGCENGSLLCCLIRYHCGWLVTQIPGCFGQTFSSVKMYMLHSQFSEFSGLNFSYQHNDM